jgi:toxin ParE1/3/4
VLRVLRTPQAQRDYDDIVEYLDNHSPAAADRFATAVAGQCRLLSRFPRLGRARNELYPGMRSVVVGKYLIFYRITSTAVEVLRILHGARNLPAIEWEPDDP